MDLSWFNQANLEEFWSTKYAADGRIKPETVPLASGSFASIYRSEDVGGEDAAGSVLRVVTAGAGKAGDTCLEKEVQAVKAFLKLMDDSDGPKDDEVVLLGMDKQPPGLCPIYAYLIVRKAEIRKIYTIMPLAKPLMDVVADQLELASSQAQGDIKFDVAEVVRWISQIAMAIRFMHTKGVFWRDCKLDNIVLVGGEAKIIDISSGVCTLGYASHEQLVKLPIDASGDIQQVTDALEQVLLDQPDHSTWETQDVFALSIVVIELLTYGQFTYPYKKDEAPPSYGHLLLYELQVFNLLLQELSSVYDVSVLKGRLDRKIKYWKERVSPSIDPTVNLPAMAMACRIDDIFLC
jgi:serine/threonine protein kinase